MVSQMEQNAEPKPPVLLVGAKDSKRLLETYVKRSLSLNDGPRRARRRARGLQKKVNAAEEHKRERRHSSDTSLHLKHSSSEQDLGEDEAFSEPEIERRFQESESTDNKSKQLKKKISLNRNYGSSASCTSDGKPNNLLVHSNNEKHDGRQTNIPSPHHKPSASELDLSKEKTFSGSISETETSDKNKRLKKNSFNRKDGSSVSQNSDGKLWKWFSPFDKDKRDGKLSHDDVKTELEVLEDSPLHGQPQSRGLTKVKKTKEGKKTKKTSVWKSFLGWFSRGNTDKEDEQDDGKPEEAVPTPELATPPFSCLPITIGDDIMRHTKPSKKRRQISSFPSKRRSRDMSLDKTSVRPCTLDVSAVNSQVQSVEEANSFYYEIMSEELKKIVNEVKNTPTEENKTLTNFVQRTETDATTVHAGCQEEIIKRIIDLIKEEGDVINDKLMENTIISSYLNSITYGSFQQLADQYVNSEVPQKTQLPVVAPELVKFAFTLDFTARVAALSRQSPVNILGFGSQYLNERFTYMCESHPHIGDATTEKQMRLKDSSNRDEGFVDHTEGKIS